MLAFGAAVLDKQSFLYLNPCEILHKNTVAVFGHVKVVGVEHSQIYIIAGFVKKIQETFYCFRVSCRKHARYILRNKKQWLFVLEYADVIIKQLTSCVLYAF